MTKSEWNYDKLKELPNDESNVLEYKSSRVPLDKLKNKISVAASSFWNSGGGVFIVGVDDKGMIDGGITENKGRQSIRDWTDLAIKQTEPIGNYEITLINRTAESVEINEGCTVLVIEFYESSTPPHMAYDGKYYIRAGAHSAGASHYQVEALRALRQFTKPNLKAFLRNHPSKPGIDELVIISINNSVGLNVSLTFEPFPNALRDHFKDDFPLEIPVIDRENPFRMDISGFGFREQTFGQESVVLRLEYTDVVGNKYQSEQPINPHKNMYQMAIGEDVNIRLAKALEAIAEKMR